MQAGNWLRQAAYSRAVVINRFRQGGGDIAGFDQAAKNTGFLPIYT
jgi:hypothetical protein